MTAIKRTIFTIIASFGLLLPMLVPAVVGAQTEEVNIGGGLCSGASFELNPDCSTSQADTSSQLTDYIRLAINIFSVIVGIVAVIMLIIGGLKYITSGGDSGNVTGAKNTILYAIIGLVIVALSQVIVQFVIGTFQQ